MSRALSMGCAGVLALGMAASSGAWAELEVRLPETTGQFDVQKHNEAALRSGFPFAVKPKVSHLGEIELRKHVESLRLATPLGESIQARDFDKGGNIVIGTTAPQSSVAITLVEKGEKGSNVVVSVRDGTGLPAKVGKGQVGVFDLEGNPLTFDVLSLSESGIEVLFEILLDRSGSMQPYIKDVAAAASEFMALLPANAKCRVTSFNDRYTAHSKDYQKCAADAHGLKNMKAGGGTLIYEPLLNSYEELAKAGNRLKAVVLITDGMGQSRISKEEVLKKKSAPTYVYWLGDYKEKQLEGIADTYIYGRQDARKVLGAFFSGIGGALTSQYVIRTPNP